MSDISPGIETEDDPLQAHIELDQRLRQYHWWFGDDDLLAEAVEGQAEWKEHPFDALEFDQGLTLYRRNQEGQIDHRDAAGLLITFTCHEAFRLLHLWNAPDVVVEYLRTGNQRLCKQAADAVRVALDAADLELQNAARLQSMAEANVPKLGFFARATARAAAQSALQKHAQAVAAYTHRLAVMHAIGATLYAAAAGICKVAWDVANEAAEVAGLLAAEEGVVVGTDERLPSLLPPGTAQAAGRGAATVNIRSRFSAMVDRLFEQS